MIIIFMTAELCIFCRTTVTCNSNYIQVGFAQTAAAEGVLHKSRAGIL